MGEPLAMIFSVCQSMITYLTGVVAASDQISFHV